MKIKLLLSFFLFSVFANAQIWEWAKSAHKKNNDAGISICTDGNGNSYVTGIFQCDTVILGVDTLINSNPAQQDLFVAKYNSSGNVLWAKSAGGISTDLSSSVCLDNSGNIYVTGSFSSTTIAFDSFILNNPNGTRHMFIVKYDSAGNVLWAKNTAGSPNLFDYGTSVSSDGNGNVYLVGQFSGDSITFENISIKNLSNGGLECFIVKYDAFGNLMWAERVGTVYAKFINTARNGNSYVTGYLLGSTVVLGNDSLISAGITDMFIAKINLTGNFVWAKNAGGDRSDEGLSVGIDSSENSYITGRFFSSSITFGNSTLINNGGVTTSDIFIVKYNSSGHVVWAKNAGGDQSESGNGISVDIHNNIYITGSFITHQLSFGNIIIYNPYPNPFNNNSVISDIFVAKYDSAGKVLWAKGTGNRMDSESGGGISVDTMGNCYVTGTFQSDSVNFSKTTLHTSLGSKTFYIAKLNRNFSFSISTNVSCSNIGSATVSMSGGFPPYSYYWGSHGGYQTTATATGLYVDTYTVDITYDPNPLEYVEVLVEVGQIMLASNFSVINETQCGSNDGSVIVNITGGTAPYTYSWSNNATTASISGLASGNYALTGVDANGCTFQGMANINCPTVVGDILEINGINISPNPTNDFFTIKSTNIILSLEIIDILGRKVFESIRGAKDETINFSFPPNGVYFIQMKTDDGLNVVSKIIKQ